MSKNPTESSKMINTKFRIVRREEDGIEEEYVGRGRLQDNGNIFL